MQNFCINCGKSHKEVGKLINCKCWFCRFPNMSHKEAAICNRRTYLTAYGKPEMLKNFENFIRAWEHGENQM